MRRQIIIFSHYYFQRKGSLIVSLEGASAGTKLIYDASHRPNVGFFVIGFLLTHLGWEVVRSTDYRMRELSRHCFGNP